MRRFYNEYKTEYHFMDDMIKRKMKFAEHDMS
jgi:hypothetical protein